MHIPANEHDVGSAPTLASTEAERIEAHEMWNVANFVAGVIDGLKKPATTGGGDGGGGLQTQNLVTDVFECTHTINGELRARRRLLALGIDNRYVGAWWTAEADTSKLGASHERRVR